MAGSRFITTAPLAVDFLNELFKAVEFVVRIGAENAVVAAVGFLDYRSHLVGEMNGSSEISLHGSANVVFAGTIAGSSRASVQTAGAIHFLQPIHAGASVQAKTRGDVELERVAGGGKVAILMCRNLKATGEVRDSAQIEAKYFGEAAVTGVPGTKVELTRVAAPQ